MKINLFAIGVLTFLICSFNSKPLPTSLSITVIDNLGNFVEGATVTIYETEEDYRNSVNPAAEPQLTDKKGRVKFKNLKSVSYYIHAIHNDKTNIGEGVQTAPLTEGKLNKVNTVIE